MSDTKTRWRMTLDELAHCCGVSVHRIDDWAMLGAFGPRYRERQNSGWHRHITRELAQRAVIMARLISAGLRADIAAAAASQHQVGDESTLTVQNSGGVYVMVNRAIVGLP